MMSFSGESFEALPIVLFLPSRLASKTCLSCHPQSLSPGPFDQLSRPQSKGVSMLLHRNLFFAQVEISLRRKHSSSNFLGASHSTRRSSWSQMETGRF